ncbi:aminotransferase [compost metagenome]
MAANAQQHGLITRAMGDAVAFCPPLIISEAEMAQLLERFARALDDTWQWVQATR